MGWTYLLMGLCGTEKYMKLRSVHWFLFTLLGQCYAHTSEMQELNDIGLSASMRQSLRRVGNRDSSELHVMLSQSTSVSFHKNPEHCLNETFALYVLCLCVCWYLLVMEITSQLCRCSLGLPLACRLKTCSWSSTSWHLRVSFSARMRAIMAWASFLDRYA